MNLHSPRGYVRIVVPGTTAIARQNCADAVQHLVLRGTLYDWATRHALRAYTGRLPVCVAKLPFDGPTVAVRHNHHGGLLARLRGDRFLAPLVRSEIDVALALTDAGIPTPEVLAQIEYRVNRFDCRVDVVTRELPPGLDLGAAITTPDVSEEQTYARWEAVACLLVQLLENGVWHPDLNVKNIYIIEEPGEEPMAALLDVDRVRFHTPGVIVGAANLARLKRSLFKWRDTRGAHISPSGLGLLELVSKGLP